MDEYFRLLGLDCSPGLRARLDGAFHAADAPSPERYAQISHNWLGDCPMQREDGLCALQCECGETALPAVCRRYPRGARGLFDRECACSNSCEAVLEMFWDREAPLGFVEGSDGGLFPEAAPSRSRAGAALPRPSARCASARCRTGRSALRSGCCESGECCAR